VTKRKCSHRFDRRAKEREREREAEKTLATDALVRTVRRRRSRVVCGDRPDDVRGRNPTKSVVNGHRRPQADPAFKSPSYS
jgi:hypothetical protein